MTTSDQTYDVIAIRIDDSTVRLIDENKTHENANAIEEMAVMRRGVEEEFFAVVLRGEYAEGDTWHGTEAEEFIRETRGDPPRIEKHGSMWYPIGPRGLDR